MKAGLAGMALLCACAQAGMAAERDGKAPAAMDGLIARHAAATGVPEALIRRVIVRESRYNPAAYNRGHYGLMQIKPATAKAMGYRGAPAGLLDADTNLTYGVRYLLGAYKVASGDHARAVRLYASGYYYDAKRRGMLADVGMGRNAKPFPAAPSVAAASVKPIVGAPTPSAARLATAAPGAPAVATPAALAYAPVGGASAAPALANVTATASKQRVVAVNVAPIAASAAPMPNTAPAKPQPKLAPPAAASTPTATALNVAVAAPIVAQPTVAKAAPKRVVAVNLAPVAASAGPVSLARPSLPAAKPSLGAGAPTPPVKDRDIQTGSIAGRSGLRPAAD